MIKRNVFTFKCKSRRANNDCFCTNFGRNDGLIMSQTFGDASMVNLFNKNIAVDIEIISPEGTRAVLSRPAGADTFTSTIS